MPNESSRIWRLRLPDDWEPDGYWCVQFSIPAHADYAEALRAVLGQLTMSKTWERDLTRTGARTVARTWANALYVNPMVVSEDCYVFPNPPTPNQPAGDDAAAAIFTVLFQHWVTYLNGCAPTADQCDQCVDHLMAELTPYGAGDAVRGALKMVCRALNDDPDHRAEFETDCPYMDEFADLRDKIAANPYDWVNKLSDWLYDWLNRTANNVLQTLNMAAGLLGGHAVAGFIDDNGGIPPGGGAGFGSEDSCEWVATLDFRESNWGFQNEDLFPNLPLGQWVAGQGWQTTTRPNLNPLTETTGMWLKLEHTDFTLHITDVVYSLHYGELDGIPSNDKIFYVYESTLQPYFATVVEGDDLIVEGPFTEWTTGESPMSIRVYTQWNAPIGSQRGFAELQQITFYGRGQNPWLNPPD